MKARDFRGDYVSQRFIVRIIVLLVVILVGSLSYLAVVNYSAASSARGTRDVLARVRVADGVSEDELFIDQTRLEKRVTRSGVFSSKAELYVKKLDAGNGNMLTFNGCVLVGTYKPVQCVADDGKTYWVTITEETDTTSS